MTQQVVVIDIEAASVAEAYAAARERGYDEVSVTAAPSTPDEPENRPADDSNL